MRLFKEWLNEHKYAYACLYMIIYLIAFFIMELVLQPKYIVHSRIDDIIPFCEYMVIPYVSWMIIFPGSLVYFVLLDKEDFLELCMVMFGGSIICFVIYAIWPTALDLRAPIERNNICSMIVKLLRSADTPTNVCPSLHVSTSTAIAVIVAKSKNIKYNIVVKGLVILWLVLICVSTCFVKQHSVIDVACGTLVTIVMCAVTYGTPWRKILRKTPLKILLD